MGLFNSKPKKKLININGYIIDELTGTLINAPKGLKVYNIPKEAKFLDDPARIDMLFSHPEEIIFEDGSVEKIQENFFNNFKNLKKIKLPSGIKRLGAYCFDPVATQCNYPNSLEYLGANMYPEIKELIIPNNITSLGSGFASHDTNLVYVEVPGSIKELPTMFVNQCKNIKKLILHEGVEKAGNMAFRGLNSLEYVELPDSFKDPFYMEMESRPGNNKRGNSSYDSFNGVFEAQENSLLTIKKIHNGIQYTFQVRKGDLGQISFQNNSATIKSRDGIYGYLDIDLEKLNPKDIHVINIKESKIEQSSFQSQQTSNQSTNTPPKPIQQTSTHSGTPINQNVVYYDEESARKYANEVLSYMLSTEFYNSLDYTTRIMIHVNLINTIKQKIGQIEKGNKFGENYIQYLLKQEVSKAREIKSQQQKPSQQNNTQTEVTEDKGRQK